MARLFFGGNIMKSIKKQKPIRVFEGFAGYGGASFGDEECEYPQLSSETYVELSAAEIFSGFEPWLTSPSNPDYTGKQKYNGYARALVKLVDFM